MSFTLPANGTCPKCGAKITITRYEPHPSKDIAYAYYACPKDGQVLVKVIDISLPKK